jgi:hypothetical protein
VLRIRLYSAQVRAFNRPRCTDPYAEAIVNADDRRWIARFRCSLDANLGRGWGFKSVGGFEHLFVAPLRQAGVHVATMRSRRVRPVQLRLA